MTRTYRIFIGIVVVGALIWTIIRDWHLIKLMPGDIRNRVVGARLQKDNQSPYFYKWKAGDGIRYYDPGNFYSYSASPSTASPFFHILLYPLADLEQQAFNKIWLALQYLLLTVSVFLCLRLAETNAQKTAVILAGAGILFTDGWIHSIVLGQLYLIPPFLAITFVYYFQHNKPPLYAVISGIVFIIALLVRPTLLLFFLPFIFLAKQYTKKYKVLFFLPSLLLLVWLLSSSTQRNLWMDYRKNIDEQVKIHYTGNATLQASDPDPKYTVWEGLDYKEMEKESKRGWFVNTSQHVNVSFLVFDIFHTKISLQLLITLFFITGAAMLIVFMYFNMPGRTVYNFSLLGYALYMLCDFFSPIVRHQYYAVQWVFPLLIAAVLFTSQYWKLYILMGICLLLNIAEVPFIKMEHTIGEYLWLVCFFYLAVFYKQQKIS
ncbi:MAG: DUF2029 domain-containing protein [Chitinophagaceae bacterium]|nr:DUF2029 domain-containing protein [Chitinophagaceae bacterium]